MFYLLDRDNDLSFVYGVPYSKAALTISGFEEGGRPIVPGDRKPAVGKTVVTCPVVQGANNWEGLSFDPDSGYAFIPTTEWCMSIGGTEAPTYVAGQHYTGAKISAMKPDNMDTTGALQAIDVATGEVVWRVDQPLGVRSPTMVTKGGVLFVGDVGTREFRAIEAATGKELWSFKTNSGVVGVPTTFEVDGVQYVAVEAGAGGNAVSDVKNAATALNVPYTEIQGGVIWVFALPQQPAAH
jgi:alcohol dehydrogenase (cytochrome c)